MQDQKKTTGVPSRSGSERLAKEAGRAPARGRVRFIAGRVSPERTSCERASRDALVSSPSAPTIPTRGGTPPPSKARGASKLPPLPTGDVSSDQQLKAEAAKGMVVGRQPRSIAARQDSMHKVAGQAVGAVTGGVGLS